MQYDYGINPQFSHNFFIKEIRNVNDHVVQLTEPLFEKTE